MAAKSLVPTLKLPTGYEIPQSSIDRKRELAKLLLQQGFDPLTNATSWLQPFGRMAKIWAGKSIDREAEKAQSEVYSSMLTDYSTKKDQFDKDVEQLRNDPNYLPEIIRKWQGDPLMQDLVKPYVEAYQSRLTGDQKVEDFNGMRTRTGAVAMGTQVDSKPTDPVIRGPNNTWNVNPVWATAQRSANGYDTTGLPQTMAAPSKIGTPPSPELEEQRQIGAWMLQQLANGNKVPRPDGMDNGQPYWIINGVAYDNPEGK